jgi:hypothetical protein
VFRFSLEVIWRCLLAQAEGQPPARFALDDARAVVQVPDWAGGV